MPSLNTIPGIGKQARELLEAAGFLDVETLARIGVEDLSKELKRANEILKITDRAPSVSKLGQWIDSAREMTNLKEEPAAPVPVVIGPVDYEATEEVVELLASAPFAIPLPARYLMEKQVGVGEIEPALLLNRYTGDLEVKVGEEDPARQAARRSQSFPRANPQVPAADAPPPAPEDDRVALLRAPLEKTNRGKNPKSRWYIRGVLHSHPFSIWFGALVTLLLAILLPLGIVSAGLLLLSDQVPKTFDWVPRWVLAFPVALPVFGISYWIWGSGAKCRICGQKLFVPKACLKNSKAHHIPGLGHIVPVSMHILLFRWFRCTFCGTAVRLKK